ncbi:hypothetical protein FB45DRAFT_72739 [Roridomyces roridus]|uniref:Uncharacterized protein n=1 Tax=Roridomyces roridus TaxID=1738132 RepID=A0AAD7BNE0_9AGAR|nr:hypothetical protein FB45DRAFT_72739 [Roridomyces roridus]
MQAKLSPTITQHASRAHRLRTPLLQLLLCRGPYRNEIRRLDVLIIKGASTVHDTTYPSPHPEFRDFVCPSPPPIHSTLTSSQHDLNECDSDDVDDFDRLREEEEQARLLREEEEGHHTSATSSARYLLGEALPLLRTHRATRATTLLSSISSRSSSSSSSSTDDSSHHRSVTTALVSSSGNAAPPSLPPPPAAHLIPTRTRTPSSIPKPAWTPSSPS